MGVVLGVMARAPVQGRCKTRLGASIGVERATALYAAMLADTLARLETLRGARRVVLAAPEDDGIAVLSAQAPGWEIVAQAGDGLGERLSHGLSTLAQGGDSVILLDSDSPTIPLPPLADALADFESGRRALLGPCADGGYYLIGLTVPETRVFEDIPWSTSGVLEATRRRCAQLQLEVEELPVCYDVDRESDLALLRAQLEREPELAPRCAGLLGLSRRATSWPSALDRAALWPERR